MNMVCIVTIRFFLPLFKCVYLYVVVYIFFYISGLLSPYLVMNEYISFESTNTNECALALIYAHQLTKVSVQSCKPAASNSKKSNINEEVNHVSM